MKNTDAKLNELYTEPPRHMDALRLYLSEIKKYPLLSREEEIELAQRKDVGDRDAFDKLVNHNQRLVLGVALKYNWNPDLLLELIQEGNLGLIRGVKKYRWDNEKGAKLSTYAINWIRAFCNNYVKRHYIKGRISQISISKKTYDDIYRIRRIEKMLGGDGDLGPELIARHPVAIEHKLKPERILYLKEFLRKSDALSSMDHEIYEDGPLLSETLDLIQEPSDMHIQRVELKMDIERAMGFLSGRERDVIKRRGYETLEEIGNSYGVSREMIRQIEIKALRKLRRLDIKETLRGHR